MIEKILEEFIRAYQKIFSPKKGILRYFFPSHFGCRFFPTCSEYAIDAVKKYGAARGCFLSLKRILRCHPFCSGGYDPLPDKLK